MKLYTYLFTICLSITLMGNAQQTPAPKQTKAIAITNATAHIGNGQVLKNSVIIFENGKIISVNKASEITVDPNNTTIINAQNKHVYPGFIAANATLGLVEVDAVKASNDLSEMGDFNPHIRSIIAYNAESKIIESMRPNGVLLGQVVPRGGRITGTSSVVQYDAWNWEDAAVKTDNGLHINWPRSFTRGRWWLGEDPALQPNKKYNTQITELHRFFNEAKSYLKGPKTTTHLPYEALQNVFNGTKRLFINVNDEKGITNAINFAETHNIKNLTLVGAYEAYKVIPLLKQHNVSVLLQRVHSRPNHNDDDYDLPFKLAKTLVDAGILVALQTSGDMERMNTRNLPFYAGTTVAYGLTKPQALQLITQNAAKILNIDANYGTLEVGKSATLFISDGDALDMRTNSISHAFIDGRKLSLETHQTALWKRYSEKLNITTE